MINEDVKFNIIVNVFPLYPRAASGSSWHCKVYSVIKIDGSLKKDLHLS